MGIQKITFDGASVSAKVDAELYHFLLSKQIGIIKDYKGGVGFTLSNNVITFTDGYVSVYGRLIYIENNTQVTVTPDSSKKGYVVLSVNTNTNDANIYIKESANSYPSLTKTNLLTSNGLYEFVLCAYSKTPTSVKLEASYSRDYIEDYLTEIYKAKNEIINDLSPRELIASIVSSGVFSVSGVNSTMLSRSIIMVKMGYTVIPIPGLFMFSAVGSKGSINYRYNSTDYSMYLSYENGILKFTCGSTSHVIDKVYLYTF